MYVSGRSVVCPEKCPESTTREEGGSVTLRWIFSNTPSLIFK